MKKILTKIIGASLAIAMMIGVGTGLNASKTAKPVDATAGPATYQHVFTAKPSTGNSVALSSVNWNISATNLGNYNSANYAGVQVGTGKSKGNFQIESTNNWGSQQGTYYGKSKVTEIRLWLNAGATTTLSTLTATVGGVACTPDVTQVTKNSSAAADWSKATKITFTIGSTNTGKVNIHVAHSSNLAFYICCLEIDCQEPANDPAVSTSSDSLFFRTGGEGQDVTATPSNFTGDVSYSWAHQSGTDCLDLTNASSATVTMTPKSSVEAFCTGVYRVTATHNSESATADVSVTVDNGGPARPYTVSEARAAIDANRGLTSAYVSGIVSSIVTEFNAQAGFISYNISADGLTTSAQLQAYKGRSFDGENFTSANDIKVGAAVTVLGTLKKYGSTYEFEQNNQLVSYTEPYTVSFETDGGSDVASQIVLEGNTAERPADPIKAADEDNNYTFVNWYDNSTLTGDPYDFDTPVTSDLILYAKWNATPLPAAQVVARLNTQSSLTYHYSKEGEATIDTLTRNSIGVTGTAYTSWGDLQDESDAVYAGITSAANSSIQMNNGKGAGIITTTSSGNAKKITVVWNSGTADGKTLQVYGKNTAYEAVTDLYDANKKGTLIGTIVCGTSTTLEIPSNYSYIGICSSGSLNLDSIKIQWGEEIFHYSNTGIRFTGTISTTLWDRLNSESTILGYGIMYATAQWCDDVAIKDWYGIARADETNVDDTFTAVQNKSYKMVKGTEIKSFYTPLSTQKPNPAQVGDVYGWSLFKNIAEEELATPYTGVAYIRTENDEIIFLNEITKSVANLAQDLIDADNEYNATSLDGSLKDLADKA